MTTGSRRLMVSGFVVLLAVSVTAVWRTACDPSRALRRAVFFNDCVEVRRILENARSSLPVLKGTENVRQPLFLGVNLLVQLESHFPSKSEQLSELNGLQFGPLHMAAFHDSQVIADVLLRHGAKPDALAAGNLTPLHIAAMRGSTNVMKLLLAAGAQVNAKNSHGFTALHMAVLAGRIDTAKLLLDSGANLLTKDSGGQTPLDRASPYQRDKLLEIRKNE